jgi:hypothetical protein
METAFKGMGYAVEVKQLQDYHDHYGLQVPNWNSDEDNADSEEEDESGSDGSDDDEDDSEED